MESNSHRRMLTLGIVQEWRMKKTIKCESPLHRRGQYKTLNSPERGFFSYLRCFMQMMLMAWLECGKKYDEKNSHIQRR